VKVPFRTLKILGKNYTVDQDEDLSDEDKGGLTNNRKQTITYIEQHHDQLRDTLLHECLHVLDYGLALDLKEEQVHSLACGIYALLKDNPQFAKWLLEEPLAPI